MTSDSPTPTSRRFVVEECDGTESPRSFEITQMFNLGSATRDAGAAVAHQEEVAEAGVRIAFDVPAPRIYPIGAWALTSDASIDVQGPRTSGEVEIVLLVGGDDPYIGVGSDHTDRDVERFSILWSKQSCPNVIGTRLWRWRDVREHWDQCVLGSTVDGRPYQDVGVSVFLPPAQILDIVAERTTASGPGLIVFCGTYVSVTGHLDFGTRWEFRLTDPVLNRELTFGYDVVEIRQAVRTAFRVPVRAGES